LAITILLFIVTNALLFITVYLPMTLLNKEGLEVYLLLIFFYFLIMAVLTLKGISLLKTLGGRNKKTYREHHE